MSIVLNRYPRSSAANRVHISFSLKALDYRQVTYDRHTGAYREPAHPTLSAIAFQALRAIDKLAQALDPCAVAKLEMRPYADVVK